MTAAYVSPIPIVTSPNYGHRDDDGNPITMRRHRFPLAKGRTMDCDPRWCRECGRERAA